MQVSRPTTGGLLLSHGNGGRPPVPTRFHSWWCLITKGLPSQATVIDTDAYALDAQATLALDFGAKYHAPHHRRAGIFEGYMRMSLLEWTETTNQHSDPTLHVHQRTLLGYTLTYWRKP